MPRTRRSTAPGPDSDDAALIRVTRRRWEKARRVPSQLAAELARASSVGQKAWVVARRELGLRARSCPTSSATSSSRAATSTASTDIECAYDVLLDDYEPGMQTTEVAGLFSRAQGRAARR